MMLEIEINKLKKEKMRKVEGVSERGGLLILHPLVPSTMSIAPVVLLQMTDSVLILEGLAIEKMKEMLSLIFGHRCRRRR